MLSHRLRPGAIIDEAVMKYLNRADHLPQEGMCNRFRLNEPDRSPKQ
jgi:hypothetical protein